MSYEQLSPRIEYINIELCCSDQISFRGNISPNLTRPRYINNNYSRWRKTGGERTTCQTCTIFVFVSCLNWRVRATTVFPCSITAPNYCGKYGVIYRVVTSRPFLLSNRSGPWRWAMWSLKVNRPNFGSVKIAPSKFIMTAFPRALQSRHGPGPGHWTKKTKADLSETSWRLGCQNTRK